MSQAGATALEVSGVSELYGKPCPLIFILKLLKKKGFQI
jgi:hypothetical protein|tara:strand:- start:77 stop:193 length:117 start_codon:yes stop_codon:yes gene_type:complete